MQILRKTEEMIYPAARSHPKLHRLSELDQMSFPVCQLFFYKQGPLSSQVLKSSLSKTLAFFYPAAGRLVERSMDTAVTCPCVSGRVGASEGSCEAVIGVEQERSGLVEGWCPAELGSKSEEEELITQPRGIGAEVKRKSSSEAVIGAEDYTNSGVKEEEKAEHMVAISGRKDVACLDQGVFFSEAWTDSQFDAFLPDFQPHPDFLALLPFASEYKDVLFKVQVTHFSCGGMCLGVVYLHNIFDGVACAHFMECWVELANGKDCLTIPPYISHVPLEGIYLPREPSNAYLENFLSQSRPWSPYPHALGVTKNKIFHFTPTFINTIKQDTSDDTCKYSSFECVAAFMWKNVTLARGTPSYNEVGLVFSVNARGRLEPALPPSYFGNAVFHAHAITRASDLLEEKLSHTTNLIRKASSKVTDEYIRRKLKWSTEQSSPMPKMLNSNIRPQEVLICNTWASLPLCGFNFGWGNPTCCRPEPCIPIDYVLLLPSSLGKGHIEVLVALKEECMQKLESLISSSIR